MFNLIQTGLDAQALQVKANRQQLTDEDIANIQASGMRLVNKPDVRKGSEITLMDDKDEPN